MWIKGEWGGYINSLHLKKIYMNKTYSKRDGDWVIDKYIVVGQLANIYDAEGDFVKNDLMTIRSFDFEYDAENFLKNLMNKLGENEKAESL